MIRKNVNFSDELEFLKQHLSIINVFLPVRLTSGEVLVLAAFMSLPEEITDPFSTIGRNMVREIAELSAGGLGNYLKQLKAKGYIKENKYKMLSILPILKPSGEEMEYQFKIKLK